MHFTSLVAGAATVGLVSAAAVHKRATNSSIWVSEVPTFVRPYAIHHYDAGGCEIGQQVYRFPVTGPSSDYAFTLIGTNAPASSALGVLPHIHERHYENFFNLKGSFQLWTEKDGVDQETRVFGPGDYGAVPHNTTHTFQILAPDTEMVGVIQPGGFEDLFYTLADSDWNLTTDASNTPYDPFANDSSSSPPASVLSQLTSFDVYAQLEFVTRTDTINGTAPLNSTWHTGANALASNAETPFFVAKDYGPKYMNTDFGYQIIQPFITPVQSAGNFSLSTITIDKILSNETAPVSAYPGHAAFEVLEGMLNVEMGGELLQLIEGDVVFIPGNTTFSYYSSVSFTKFLHIGAGSVGLDTTLIKKGAAWASPVWPTYA